MKNNPIYVTQPSLASLEEYTELLQGVWNSGILTHNGPLVRRFEKELSEKLNIENFVAVTNGTIAIQMAIKALELKGEIITTPFTWVATISAIKWEGCIPIFCDIDQETLNIDPEKIEEDYGSDLDIMINAGPGSTGESTILDCTGDEIVVIREGLGELS